MRFDRRTLKIGLDEAERLSYTVLEHRRSILSQILHNAQYEGRILVHPFAIRKVKIPGKKRNRVDVPDASDMRELMAFMNGPKPAQRSYISWSGLRVAIMLAASSGLRAEEICALRWDHIDPHTGEPDIREAIVGGFGSRVKVSQPKTEASIRKVPLTHSGRRLISEHAELYKEWFGDVRGWPVGYVVKPARIDAPRPYITPHQLSFQFRGIVRQAGIVDENGTQKMHFHQLRHWFGSVAVKYHSDNHYVRKLMGHTNLSMTLDTDAGYIDEPRSREEFLQMPDWLDPDTAAKMERCLARCCRHRPSMAVRCSMVRLSLKRSWCRLWPSSSRTIIRFPRTHPTGCEITCGCCTRGTHLSRSAKRWARATT